MVTGVSFGPECLVRWMFVHLMYMYIAFAVSWTLSKSPCWALVSSSVKWWIERRWSLSLIWEWGKDAGGCMRTVHWQTCEDCPLTPEGLMEIGHMLVLWVEMAICCLKQKQCNLATFTVNIFKCWPLPFKSKMLDHFSGLVLLMSSESLEGLLC